MQPRCFVMMPFKDEFKPAFERAIEPAVESCGFQLRRSDFVTAPGRIYQQIEDDIRGASVCIADVTGSNANVIYEVGIAGAIGKPVIIITQDPPESAPFDITGLRMNKYEPSDEGCKTLKKVLKVSLEEMQKLGGSSVRLLEDMLVPASLRYAAEQRFAVVARLLSHRESRHTEICWDEIGGTRGDNVGIRGLIQAFGIILGPHRLPELLDPGDYVEKVAYSPLNLYCIGSPKSNLWTGLLLKEFSKQWLPEIRFAAMSDSPDLRDIQVDIKIGKIGPKDDPHFPEKTGFDDVDRRDKDFGVVIRGPHPAHPEFMVLLLAGRSGLGTEAVCRAVTDPKHIRTIREMCQTKGVSVNIEDHNSAFYAVVSVEKDRNSKAPSPDLNTLRVHEVKPLHRNPAALFLAVCGKPL